MDRLALAAALAVVIVGIAVVLQRRGTSQPATTPVRHDPPDRLDRSDFVRPDAPWLVVVFTSATCSTCGDVWSKADLLDSDEVAVQEVEVGRDGALHARYGIGAVPIVVVADRGGVVRRSFMGPVSSTHLWAALAELREPGTIPPDCGG